MNNRTYNLVASLTVYVIPIIGAAYFIGAQAELFPAGQQVLGSLMFGQLFLGLLLAVSNRTYDGSLTIFEEPSGKITFTLELEDDPMLLEGKKDIRFKVKTTK